MKIPPPGSSLAVAAILLVAAVAVPIPRAFAQTQTLSPASAEPVEVVPYAVIDRGAHYNRIAHVLALTNNLGRVIYQTNGYTEIGTGLNHLVKGQWVESQENIEVTANGAQATNAAHQVFFSGNANSQTAVQLITADGKQLTTRVVSLGYLDPVTGSTALISQLQDSIGQLLSPNEAIYTNALGGTNGCIADIYYHFTKAGLEQNIILRTQLPAPEAFPNMNSADGVLLQVTTAFGDSPAPVIITNATALAQGVLDEFLDFGAMQIGRGKAFLIGDNPPDAGAEDVYKQWVVTDTASYLVEQILLTPSVMAQLQTLPPPASTGTNGNGAMLRAPHPLLAERAGVRAKPPHSLHTNPALANLASRITLPASHFSPTPAVPFRLARSDAQYSALRTPRSTLGKGFLVDYSILSSQTNFTAQADTTYFVNTNSSVILSGTNTFEGGTVIKFATNSSLTLTMSGIPLKINWLGAQFRPVVLTAQDDNSLGETITNSTGNPSGYYASTALKVVSPPSGLNMSGFRIAYAQQAVNLQGMSASISDGQILNCADGMTIVGGGGTVKNVLFSNVATNFNSSQDGGFTCVNDTFSSSEFLVTLASTSDTNTTSFSFDNCILAGVTSLYNLYYTSISGSYNGFYNSLSFGSSVFTTATYPFQTVGAGGFYLANNSPFLGVGTNLVADLTNRTTYPPVVIYGAGKTYPTNDLILYPQAPRDTAQSTLGYHYDPLDFVFGACYMTNSVTIEPGTVIGTFGTNAGAGNGLWGLAIDGPGKFVCQGTPTSPAWVVRYNTAQDQSNTNWTGGIGPCLAYARFVSPSPTIYCRFTDFSVLALDAYNFQVWSGTVPGAANFQDCQVSGGRFGSTGNGTFNATNCLFQRVDVEAPSDGTDVPVFRNNLVWNGTFDFDPAPITNAFVKDNLFDHAIVSDNSSDYGTYNGGNNAYVTNSLVTNAAFLIPTNAADKILTNSPVYQSAWLGNFYYPSGYQLIDAGHTNANLLALFHFCSTTNQLKETNSIVDIGLHYVAVGINGLPLSYSGDGIGDYLLDSNGDGVFDTGDLGNWQTYNSPNNLSGAPGLVVFTPLK